MMYYLSKLHMNTLKDRLIKLNLLMFFEYLDVIFLVKLLKFPDIYPNLSKYLVFPNVNTRASTFSKLSHNFVSTNKSCTCFFNRIVRLWNVLPVIDTSKSLETIKFHLFFSLD